MSLAWRSVVILEAEGMPRAEVAGAAGPLTIARLLAGQQVTPRVEARRVLALALRPR